MYQCSDKTTSPTCKKTAGYIKIKGENDTINYYSIPMNNDKSSLITENNLFDNCSYSSLGYFYKNKNENSKNSTDIALCVNGYHSITFPYASNLYEKTNYLISLNDIKQGVFKYVNINQQGYSKDMETTIAISIIPGDYNYPSMIAFDSFYSG